MAHRVHSVPLPPQAAGAAYPLRASTADSPSPIPLATPKSRNDLFNTSWLPEIPPPRPLQGSFGRDQPSPGSAWGSKARTWAAPRTVDGASAGSIDADTSTSTSTSRRDPDPQLLRERDSPQLREQPTASPALTPSPIPSGPSNSYLHTPASWSPRRTPAPPVPTPLVTPPPSHSHTVPAPVHPDVPERLSPMAPMVGSTLVASPPTSPTDPFHKSFASPSPSPFLLNLNQTPAHMSHMTHMSPTSEPATGTSTPASISKTSNFFASAAADTPPPAPRLNAFTPSPLSLSRASSLRARALPARPPAPPSPPPLTPDDGDDGDFPCCLSPTAAGPLRALHQSPNLLPSKAAAGLPPLPRPPAADDIQLRLYPNENYLLGEGRHACVYLAAYRRVDGTAEASLPSPAASGSGDSEWTLCAAKRLAADRESQTLGLREAFFLNRVGQPRRQRPGSPLGKDADRGRVYCIKLIAVKEDEEAGVQRSITTMHSRSVSDSVDSSTGSPATSGPGTPSALAGSPARRPRSSTIYAGSRQESSPGTVAAVAAVAAESARLVLVLEHAPLGTLDRLLRTSPHLVGQQLWGRWAREAAEALEWVHSRGVVHADIKPSNLLLTADLHIRLSDFGSSLLVHPAHPPTDGVGLGTLPFSPPELVDPTAPFSFPVDIFALGATLYQCITGREPYRGIRRVEMMHHVRNGGLWAWEERERLDILETGANTPAGSNSPYPSALREEPVPALGAEMKRGGSLRIAKHTPTRGTLPLERTRLSRVGSAESLQAADDVVTTANESPSGIKLWHQWVKGRHPPTVERLLRSGDSPPPSPTPAGAGGSVSRSSSLRMHAPVSRSSSIRSIYKSPTSPTAPHWPVPSASEPVSAEPYADGAPAMFFLGEGVRVPDDVRDVLRAMLEAAPEARPTAAELVSAWETLGVGCDEVIPEE